MKQKITFFLAIILLALPFSVPEANAQLSAIRTIIFPVIGSVTYYDDFANPRSGGRTHEGNDLMGRKMMPLVAAVDGTITNVNYPEESWGYSVTIRDSDGYRYVYIHMNNDTPGTDDGRGDGMNAYAPDIQEGNKVVKGQLIGYLGDSGNAEGTQAHLHFEIREPDGQAYSPYKSLQNATKITTPVTNYPPVGKEFLPYADFKGGVNIATGNTNTDRDLEIVTGARAGGGPLVKVFSDDHKELAAWYAYDPNFRGGVDVAMGDVDKDGKAEIITAPGPGGGPHIKIFKANGSLISEFFAYDSTFRGGVFVSSTDLNKDGEFDIITGAGPGGGPHVRLFSAKGVVLKEFFAYDPTSRGGVDVAGVPKTTETTAKIITAPASGLGSQIKVYDGNLNLKEEFTAYDTNFSLGLRISVGILNSDVQIATVPASGGGPHIKFFEPDGSTRGGGLRAFEEWWRGGYDVAIMPTSALMSSGSGRRGSVRPATTSTRTRFSN